MAAQNVRWLLVGAGDIAHKRVAPALSEAEGSSLAAVCDVDPEKAQLLARNFSIPSVYFDLEAALGDPGIDAVYVATPVFLHVPLAMQAVEADKHVLVEKPLGRTASECAPLVQKAAEKRLKAGCAYFRRFYPRYSLTRQMLEKGEFGRLVLIRMTYFSWCNPPKEDPQYWRVLAEKSGGGPLADMGCHMFDVLIGLMGMPVRIFAKTKTLVHDYPVEDSAVILGEMNEGADLVATFNWNSKTWSHEFEIVGTEAKLKWHPYDTGKVLKTVGRDIQEIDCANARNVHIPLVEDFVQAIREDRSPCIPFEEAVKTNLVLDAVYRSSRTGTEVIL